MGTVVIGLPLLVLIDGKEAVACSMGCDGSWWLVPPAYVCSMYFVARLCRYVASKWSLVHQTFVNLVITFEPKGLRQPLSSRHEVGGGAGMGHWYYEVDPRYGDDSL